MFASVGSATGHAATNTKTIATVATIDYRAPSSSREEIRVAGRPRPRWSSTHTSGRAGSGSGVRPRTLSGPFFWKTRHWAARALQLRDHDRFWRRRRPSACGRPVAAQPITWLRRSPDDPDSGIVMGSSSSCPLPAGSVGSSECRTLESRLALLAGADATGRLVDVGERDLAQGRRTDMRMSDTQLTKILIDARIEEPRPLSRGRRSPRLNSMGLIRGVVRAVGLGEVR